MPEFTCDLSRHGQPLPHVWEACVGSGHAPLALRADWQAQLAQCHHELGVEYVRFHGLLSDDMGTLIAHEGRLVYSFFNATQITDFLVSIGMRPFVELSFMPSALASGDATVFRYRANITPPRDDAQWAALVRRLVRHWVDRYGAAEVRRWFFEVWNEPNLADFWTGTQDEYFKLYRATAEAVKSVDAGLRVGGPATANNGWIADFVAFCDRHGLPADFVSTHQYPTDAFGQPGDDTEAQLAASKRGILRERAEEVVRQAAGRPVYYTEWSTSSNPFFARHDTPAAAAQAMAAWLGVADLVQGFSYWTFSDLFEEHYFSSAPFHGGFGLLTIHGIAKPTYRAAELLHRVGDERLDVDGRHATVEVHVVRGEEGITVLLMNHALPRHPIRAERVRLVLKNAAEPRGAWVERIDEEHANPRRLWEQRGWPEALSPADVEALEAASALAREPARWTVGDDGTLCFALGLPAQAVAALTIALPPLSRRSGPSE